MSCVIPIATSRGLPIALTSTLYLHCWLKFNLSLNAQPPKYTVHPLLYSTLPWQILPSHVPSCFDLSLLYIVNNLAHTCLFNLDLWGTVELHYQCPHYYSWRPVKCLWKVIQTWFTFRRCNSFRHKSKPSLSCFWLQFVVMPFGLLVNLPRSGVIYFSSDGDVTAACALHSHWIACVHCESRATSETPACMLGIYVIAAQPSKWLRPTNPTGRLGEDGSHVSNDSALLGGFFFR